MSGYANLLSLQKQFIYVIVLLSDALTERFSVIFSLVLEVQMVLRDSRGVLYNSNDRLPVQVRM